MSGDSGFQGDRMQRSAPPQIPVARAKKTFGATAQALARPHTYIAIPPPPVRMEGGDSPTLPPLYLPPSSSGTGSSNSGSSSFGRQESITPPVMAHPPMGITSVHQQQPVLQLPPPYPGMSSGAGGPSMPSLLQGAPYPHAQQGITVIAKTDEDVSPQKISVVPVSQSAIVAEPVDVIMLDDSEESAPSSPAADPPPGKIQEEGSGSTSNQPQPPEEQGPSTAPQNPELGPGMSPILSEQLGTPPAPVRSQSSDSSISGAPEQGPPSSTLDPPPAAASRVVDIFSSTSGSEVSGSSAVHTPQRGGAVEEAGKEGEGGSAMDDLMSMEDSATMMERMLAKSLGEIFENGHLNQSNDDTEIGDLELPEGTGDADTSLSQLIMNYSDDVPEADTASEGRGESPEVPDFTDAKAILGPDFAMPLCQCRIPSRVTNEECPVTRCQSINSVDREMRGCSNELLSEVLFRPHVRIPFMALCDAHIGLLRMHVCCPICGVFCLKGTCPHCDFHDFQLTDVNYLEEMCMTPLNGLGLIPKDSFGRALMRMPKRKLARNSTLLEENPVVPALRVKSAGRTLNASLVGKKDDKERLNRIFHELSKGWRPQTETTLKTVMLETKAVPGEALDLLTLCYVIANKGEDPNQKLDQKQNTALHLAVERGDFLASYILLMCGSDPNLTNSETHMPLVSACHNGKAGLAQMLLRFGADPSIKVHYEETDGSTALHIAAVGGHTAVVHFLLTSKKIKINAQDDGGWTALFWATEHGQADVSNLLLDRGAKPMLKDLEGNNCLHWAAYSGSQQISERLLQINGARALTETNRFGDTPLHVAARQKHWTLVELFLLHGADVNKVNANGESPSNFIRAATRHDIQLANLLKEALQKNKDKNIAERILTTDLARERENFPIPVVNDVDREQPPADFQYVSTLVETQVIQVDRLVNKFRCCQCRDDCSSGQCECNVMNDFDNRMKKHAVLGCAYNEDRTLSDHFFEMQASDTIYECNVACSCVNSCRNRVAQKGLGYRFQIYKTPDRGWGVKILEAVRRGTYICEYAGEILTGDEADSREDDSYLFELEVEGQSHCIDAKFYGNMSRFVNHSCSPNLMPVRVLWDHQDVRFSHICFYASRDIARDEELSFDYGEKFWIVKYRYFRCKCGHDNCKYSDDKIEDFIRNYQERQDELDRSGEGETSLNKEEEESDTKRMKKEQKEEVKESQNNLEYSV